jgi:hypothetical protein
VATILELELEDLPQVPADENPANGSIITRWLGGLGLGLVRIAEPGSFSWPGPWIARLETAPQRNGRYVVMYGTPSGVVWDPTDQPGSPDDRIADGFLIAAADIATARPATPPAPIAAGTVEAICIAPDAGAELEQVDSARALTGSGLEGDRYVRGTGTFDSGVPGSALTLIEAEVCESFDPPLMADEHRRNIVTRGIDLNALVGHRFTVGEVLCEGVRLCEPCTVVDGYARRPVLRALVHRGGLRAEILEGGDIKLGDVVQVAPAV